MNKATFIVCAVVLLLGISAIPSVSSAQSWETYDISYSGCRADFPYEPGWEISSSQDSSLLWLGEVDDSDIFYGIICVEFAYPFDDEATEEDMITIAEGYLDYLMKEFEIVSHSGYETGYYAESISDAYWISDSWEDAEGDPWLIRTYIDYFNLVVMYTYSSPDIPMTESAEYYFGSFRFME